MAYSAEPACSGGAVVWRRPVMDRLRTAAVARRLPQVKSIVSYRLKIGHARRPFFVIWLQIEFGRRWAYYSGQFSQRVVIFGAPEP